MSSFARKVPTDETVIVQPRTLLYKRLVLTCFEVLALRAFV